MIRQPNVIPFREHQTQPSPPSPPKGPAEALIGYARDIRDLAAELAGDLAGSDGQALTRAQVERVERTSDLLRVRCAAYRVKLARATSADLRLVTQ